MQYGALHAADQRMIDCDESSADKMLLVLIASAWHRQKAVTDAAALIAHRLMGG